MRLLKYIKNILKIKWEITIKQNYIVVMDKDGEKITDEISNIYQSNLSNIFNQYFTTMVQKIAPT